jgi:hypothetical protein
LIYYFFNTKFKQLFAFSKSYVKKRWFIWLKIWKKLLIFCCFSTLMSRVAVETWSVWNVEFL